MIAPLRTSSVEHQSECVQDQFLAMLPQIQRQARIAFRGLGIETREELVQEVVANVFCAFVQLVRRGKRALAFPSPLTKFAVRQVRAGRRVGSQLNKQDLLSPYARRIQGFTIERLDQFEEQSGGWHQLLVEDRQAGPAETAAARIDIAEWLSMLSTRQRRIANAMALGEPTGVVARRFGLCPARISQLRTWFRRNWKSFQGGTQPEGCVV